MLAVKGLGAEDCIVRQMFTTLNTEISETDIFGTFWEDIYIRIICYLGTNSDLDELKYPKHSALF